LNVTQLRNTQQVDSYEKLGCLMLVENSSEVEKIRKLYCQIVNIVTLQQSEKFFINKRINSKILIGNPYN